MAQTPEAWRVREVTKFHHDDQSTTLEALEIWSDSDLICIDVDTEEHARLIAAAPDMLSVLTMLRDADDMGKPDGQNFMGAEMRAAVDDAIAKVEGGAQ
jgi:hypothetical protein